MIIYGGSIKEGVIIIIIIIIISIIIIIIIIIIKRRSGINPIPPTVKDRD